MRIGRTVNLLMKAIILKSNAKLVLGGLLAMVISLSAQAKDPENIPSGVLRIDYERLLPVSRLDLPAKDQGFAGAELAKNDNNTTGRFTGHNYTLETVVGTPETAVEKLKLAPDTDLRSENCRANVLHVVPSRQMRADALTQFLIWKRWNKWALLSGSNPKDQVQVQRQLPILTQNIKAHDVVVTADESDYFAIYLPYHIWSASTVAGSAGLMPLSWHPAVEAWGATQVQRRFEKLTERRMTEDDYHAWMALRVLGEAVTRVGKFDKQSVLDYTLSEGFEMAAFKGQKATFRLWNGQLRQSMILGDGRIMVSVSPQDGFLHQHTTLDTMGLDEPESKCTAFK